MICHLMLLTWQMMTTKKYPNEKDIIFIACSQSVNDGCGAGEI